MKKSSKIIILSRDKRFATGLKSFGEYVGSLVTGSCVVGTARARAARQAKARISCMLKLNEINHMNARADGGGGRNEQRSLNELIKYAKCLPC